MRFEYYLNQQVGWGLKPNQLSFYYTLTIPPLLVISRKSSAFPRRAAGLSRSRALKQSQQNLGVNAVAEVVGVVHAVAG